MFKLTQKIPEQFALAFSGGSDSVAAALFFLKSGKKFHLLHYNHKTDHSDSAQAFAESFALTHGLKLDVYNISGFKPKLPDQSMEEYWREARYSIFDNYDYPVVTAHHLDDAIETYLYNCLHGKAHTMPIYRGNVLRLFLLAPQAELHRVVNLQPCQHIEDPSNYDVRYMRNLIRHQIKPKALIVNPGLYKIVSKKIIQGSFNENPHS